MADIVNNVENNKEQSVAPAILKESRKQQQEVIDRLINDKEEVANLRVDLAKLESNKVSEDHILIVTEGNNSVFGLFGSFVVNDETDKVYLNINDDRIKGLVTAASKTRIKNLEEEITNLNEKNSDLRHINHELRLERQELKEKVVNNKRDLKVQLDNMHHIHDETIKAYERDISSIRQEAKLDLKNYKAAYNDRLNDLYIQVRSTRELLENFQNKLRKSFLFKFFGKKLAEVKNAIGNIQWKSADLVVA